VIPGGYNGELEKKEKKKKKRCLNFTLRKIPSHRWELFTEIRNFLGSNVGVHYFRKAPVLGLYPTYYRAGTIITKGVWALFFFYFLPQKEREREREVQRVGAFA
jgi:hypothetical protein